MIRITPGISIDESEIHESFVRAGGPGGQNVNKVSTAVELRFDVAHSPNLPDEVKARLSALAGSRVTVSGELLIQAHRHRTQAANRQDALERLTDLIRQATIRPRRRRATRPTLASKQRRLVAKRHKGEVKRQRKAGPGEQ